MYCDEIPQEYPVSLVKNMKPGVNRLLKRKTKQVRPTEDGSDSDSWPAPYMHKREACAYPRVWGINVGKIEGKITVEGVLDDGLDNNERKATTADLTTLAGDLSDEDSDDDKDFAAENRPRPLPDKLLYNGNGMSINHERDVLERLDASRKTERQRPGRSKNGATMPVLCERKHAGL